MVGLEPPPNYDSYNRGRVQRLRPVPFDFKPFVEKFKTWKRADLLDRLHEDLFQAEAILPTRDTLKHPQIVFNGMAVPVVDPEVGPTTQVGIPCKLSLTPGKVKGPRPAPGQHNAEVFAEQRAPKAHEHCGRRGAARTGTRWKASACSTLGGHSLDRSRPWCSAGSART